MTGPEDDGSWDATAATPTADEEPTAAATGEGLVDPAPAADERDVENSLRPRSLDEFVGQPKVREQLHLVLQSAVRRGRPPDHVLLSGPPGLGKTSLAMIVATELGVPIRVTSGPAIERAGDLAALLTSLAEGEVLFIDEIHRIARPAEEIALHGDGGLPRRRHRRQGPRRHGDPARSGAVHPGRRHHPRRAADRPAARPVRLHRPHGLLRAG